AVQKSSTWVRGGAPLRFAKLQGVAGTLTASYKSSYACTAELVSAEDASLARPRFYTRREFARLMGFPDKEPCLRKPAQREPRVPSAWQRGVPACHHGHSPKSDPGAGNS
ncbi:scrFIAM, partial [Symbiodinium pilosum]